MSDITMTNWQQRCIESINDKPFVILASPTGSGKTTCYEEWALGKKERPIFITAPIKALSNQRFRDLKAKGYNVALETGDVSYFPSETCDIICCTQEIYNYKYRDIENSTVVIDEFSYIYEDPSRSRAYVEALIHSKAKNIIMCSATFGNTNEVLDYIRRISGKDFFLFENHERLTELEYVGEIEQSKIRDSFVVAFSHEDCKEFAKRIAEQRFAAIKKLSPAYDPRNRNKGAISRLVEKYRITRPDLIEYALMGVVYYYGRLLLKEKMFVEELFESKLVDTVVGTDALALGVNFPIKNVVFSSLSKGGQNTPGHSLKKTISKNMFEQLAGRAGRKRYFDKGYVYYCNDFKKEDLKKQFWGLVKKPQEQYKIVLGSNIAAILSGKITVDEDSRIRIAYSTAPLNYQEITSKTQEVIDFIKNLDITAFYFDKIYGIDISGGFYQAISKLNPARQKELEEKSITLANNQQLFEQNIGKTYVAELSPAQNCMVLIDLLIGTPLEEIMKRIAYEYKTRQFNVKRLLELRKCINRLAWEHSKEYDVSILDNLINSIDPTVLAPDKYQKRKELMQPKEQPKQQKKKERKREPLQLKSSYSLMQYGGKQYVKLLSTDTEMLLCEYIKDKESLELITLPIQTYCVFMRTLGKRDVIRLADRINRDTIATEEAQEIVALLDFARSIQKATTDALQQKNISSEPSGPAPEQTPQERIGNLETQSKPSETGLEQVRQGKQASKKRPIRLDGSSEVIKYDNKYYVKLLSTGSEILLCDYSSDSNGPLNLKSIPMGTKYTFVSMLPRKARKKLVDRIDMDSISTLESKEMIELLSDAIKTKEASSAAAVLQKKIGGLETPGRTAETSTGQSQQAGEPSSSRRTNNSNIIAGDLRLDYIEALMKKSPDKAKSELECELGKNPENMYYQFYYGKLCQAADDFEAAEKAYTLVAESNSKNKYAGVVGLADIAVIRGNSEVARLLYHRAIEENPEENSTTYYALAKLESSLGNYDEALRILDSLDENSNAKEIEKARMFIHKGDMESASKIIEKVVPQDEKEMRELAHTQAQIYIHQENYSAAEESLFRAKEYKFRDPYYYRILLDEIAVAHATKNYQLAANDCEEYIYGTDSENGDVYVMLGLAKQALGDYQSAINCFRRAFGKKTLSYDYKAISSCSLASIQIAMGEIDKAEQTLKSCLNPDMQQSMPIAHILLNIYITQKRYDEAKQLISTLKKTPKKQSDLDALDFASTIIAARTGKIPKDERLSNLSYQEKQAIEYDKKDAIEYITAHHQSGKKQNNKFPKDKNISELYDEVIELLSEDNRCVTGIVDRYYIDYPNIGYTPDGEIVNRLEVVTLPGTKDIVTMYPDGDSTAQRVTKQNMESSKLKGTSDSSKSRVARFYARSAKSTGTPNNN